MADRCETDFAQLATRERVVSFGSSSDSKELIRQAIDIVELVGKYCQLRRQGRNYVALCPWHDDTRPSLQINPERQSFKCWVCDIGGDVFSFVMKMEGVTFPEALALLADQAGIALKPVKGQAPGGSDKRALYRAMVWAEEQYHRCLLDDPEAEIARRYLQQRSVTAESIAKFHLGYSPNHWDWILRRAQGSGVNQRMLETIGLLAQSMEGRCYDRFRGRVLFSIRDVQGRPVGVGGRVLPESGNTSPAKYINSPETPLFAKSRLLYGLDIARDSIRKSRTAMIMEGYTDVILAHQFGFDNAVAVLGTALNSEHIKILKRFTDRILLVLDGDEAGQRRAKEILELFVAQNVDLRVVVLPDDLDPCDFLVDRGAEAFREVLSAASCDALDHAVRVWTQGIDLANDIHAASEALDRLVAIVAKAPRLREDSKSDFRFREERILQRLATSFRVPEQDVRNRMTALRRAEQQRNSAREEQQSREQEAGSREQGAGNVEQVTPGSPPSSPLPAPRSSAKPDPWQRELLEILVRHPEHLAVARAAIRPKDLDHEICREIYLTACWLADDGTEPSFERLLLEFEDPAIKSLLVELDENGAAKNPADPKAVLEELIKTFEHRQSTRQRPVATSMLREGRLDERQELDLLQQMLEQERARQGISRPTDGQDPGPG